MTCAGRSNRAAPSAGASSTSPTARPPVAGLPRLRVLWLGGPGIDDACAQRLGTMRQLEELILWDTSLTDAGLAHLCRLPELRDLRIRSPHLTSAGLDALAGLPKLQVLWLDGPALNDDALAKLARLTRLRELWLLGGPFTPAAVERLKQALANCDVRVNSTTILAAPPATNPAGSQVQRSGCSGATFGFGVQPSG